MRTELEAGPAAEAVAHYANLRILLAELKRTSEDEGPGDGFVVLGPEGVRVELGDVSGSECLAAEEVGEVDCSVDFSGVVVAEDPGVVVLPAEDVVDVEDGAVGTVAGDVGGEGGEGGFCARGGLQEDGGEGGGSHGGEEVSRIVG